MAKQTHPFFPGNEEPISKEEADQLDAAWNCGPRLMENLEGWTGHALAILSKPEEPRTKHKGDQKNGIAAAKEAAQRVLGNIDALREAIFRNQDNHCLIAERGLTLGFEIAKAHTLGFIAEYQTGTKVTKAVRKGGGHNRTPDDVIREWQRLADELWAVNDTLSMSDVAREISARTAGNFNTIRTKIIKPK